MIVLLTSEASICDPGDPVFVVIPRDLLGEEVDEIFIAHILELGIRKDLLLRYLLHIPSALGALGHGS